MVWDNGKDVSFRVENFFNFALSKKWTISDRASCTCSYAKTFVFVLEGKVMLCYIYISYCFCSFDEFAKVFQRQVWHVRVTHLHIEGRALSSPSWCFQIIKVINKSWQILFSLSSLLRCYNNLNNFKRLLTSCAFLSPSKTLHCEIK